MNPFGRSNNLLIKARSAARIRRLRKAGRIIYRRCFIDDMSVIGEKVILRENCRVCESEIGKGSSIAPNNALLRLKIGKFSSIASGVHFVLGNHPTTFVSTSQYLYDDGAPNGFGFERPVFSGKFVEAEPGFSIVIGNDVWIGEGAFIKGGVKIGDGAIIGMGAMVTKDVPPYAIIVGNPGRILRYRFTEKTRQELSAAKWWDWEEIEISKYVKYFSDADDLLNHLRMI